MIVFNKWLRFKNGTLLGGARFIIAFLTFWVLVKTETQNKNLREKDYHQWVLNTRGRIICTIAIINNFYYYWWRRWRCVFIIFENKNYENVPKIIGDDDGNVIKNVSMVNKLKFNIYTNMCVYFTYTKREYFLILFNYGKRWNSYIQKQKATKWTL